MSRRVPDWVAHVPNDGVLNLVPSLAADAPAPTAPQLKHPGSRGALRFGWFGLAVAAAGVVGLIALMFIDEGPHWGNILGAVVIGLTGLVGLVLALGGLLIWKEKLELFPRMLELWRTQPPRQPVAGSIIDRYVSVDEGDVSAIYVRVALDDEREYHAQWHAQRGGNILQPQVPNVGSPVRAWIHDEGPYIIEAADPTGSFRPAQLTA